MAGGIKDGIWAVVSDTEWCWMYGEPTNTDPNLTYKQMLREPMYDQVSCVVHGRKLVLSGHEMVNASDRIVDRIKPLPGLAGLVASKNDQAFVGFDNLPELEFGTGWDDFDWSK